MIACEGKARTQYLSVLAGVLVLACTPRDDENGPGPVETGGTAAEETSSESASSGASESSITSSTSSEASSGTEQGNETTSDNEMSSGDDASMNDEANTGNEDTVDAGSDTSESETVGDSESGDDSGDEAGDDSEGDTGDPEYECKDGRDVIFEQKCIRDRDCSLVNPCDDGYECDEIEPGRMACKCSDPAICGIVCTSDSECPRGEYECDPTIGACRYARTCLTDLMCGGTAICIDGVCGPPGAKVVGTRCQRNSDCRSGVCQEDVCLKKCRNGSECEGGQSCRTFHTTQACVANDFACDGECSPDDICRGDCLPGCYTTGECPAGSECLHLNDEPGNFFCWTHEEACQSDEFFHSDSNSACLLHRQCFADADCPNGYACLDDDDLRLSRNRYQSTRVCGRLVP